MIFKKLIFSAFITGIIFNVCTLVLAIVYIIAVENYFKPFDFKHSIKLGTILSASNMFDFKNLKDKRTIPRWQAIESKFDFFIPDVALRSDERGQKSPRVDDWCRRRANRCWAHRVAYDDSRKKDYRIYTVDDWFFKNSRFLNTSHDAQVRLLDVFLAGLPGNAEVVLNEPLALFQSNPKNFQLFKDWVIILRRKHPSLKFKLGLQLHFQWLDTQFLRLSDGVLFSQFADFSKNYDIPWGILEFSIYDRVWRRRLQNTYVAGRRTDGLTSSFESLVPDRLRRAIVLHQAYIIHRDVVRSGASFIVEWGNFPTIWFSGEIDQDYRSTFALFDWDGRPLPMWWAVARGMDDGKK
ncbi:hypothetical protein [Microcoleus sp. B4-C1]|uniref:hypothetical protein n=1 Tax=Microcoleus sp. B4-C1 TaxID=2818660 RepID=UPI002FD4459A